MQVIGIVAEYNPFHTGHAYQIARTRQALEENCAVVAVMSGNWVQGDGRAVLDKWTRARLALLGGADLVLELPTVWAVSSAETFARGAVTILERSGVVDVLSFGSESAHSGGCGEVREGGGDEPAGGGAVPFALPAKQQSGGWSTCGHWTA